MFCAFACSIINFVFNKHLLKYYYTFNYFYNYESNLSTSHVFLPLCFPPPLRTATDFPQQQFVSIIWRIMTFVVNCSSIALCLGSGEVTDLDNSRSHQSVTSDSTNYLPYISLKNITQISLCIAGSSSILCDGDVRSFSKESQHLQIPYSETCYRLVSDGKFVCRRCTAGVICFRSFFNISPVLIVFDTATYQEVVFSAHYVSKKRYFYTGDFSCNIIIIIIIIIYQ